MAPATVAVTPAWAKIVPGPAHCTTGSNVNVCEFAKNALKSNAKKSRFFFMGLGFSYDLLC